MKKVISFMFLCLAMFLLVACDTTPPPPTCPRTIKVTINSITDIKRTEIKTFCEDELSTTLTAETYSDYGFDGWYNKDNRLITKNIKVDVELTIDFVINAKYYKYTEYKEDKNLFKVTKRNVQYEPNKETEINHWLYGKGKKVVESKIIEEHGFGLITDLTGWNNPGVLKNDNRDAEPDSYFINIIKNASNDTGFKQFTGQIDIDTLKAGVIISAISGKFPKEFDLSKYRPGQYKLILVANFSIIELYEYDLYNNQKSNEKRSYLIMPETKDGSYKVTFIRK